MGLPMSTVNIGHEVLPVQQPLLLSGGTVPPLNVFHNPIWMNQNKPEEQQINLEQLSQLNKQLDAQLYKLNPMMQQQQMQQQSNLFNNRLSQISSISEYSNPA
jgi:hypothetical protein